jgi:DNA primase
LNPNIDLPTQETIIGIASRSLFDVPGNDGAVYLRNDRGITKATAKVFELGFCPPDSRHEFSDSIVIPIRDLYGELVATQVRWLPRSVSGHNSTYWHTRYEKSNHLFGLHINKNRIRETNHVVVVEGAFDAIALWQVEIPAVAVIGTAFSRRHTALLLRYCKNVCLMFDTDKNKSGQNSSIRTKVLLEGAGFHAVSAELPIGVDPDVIAIRGGRKVADEYINKAWKTA